MNKDDSDIDIDYEDDGENCREIEIREQDRFLPIANIARIMKKVLPQNAKIAKEAKESIQECVSEFISFITSEASDKCQQEKRKTINGDDILWAMGTLGFDKYAEPLKTYLAKYRDSVRGDKPEKKPSGKKEAAQKMSTHPTGSESMPMSTTYVGLSGSGDGSVVMAVPGELPLPAVAPGKSVEGYQGSSALLGGGSSMIMSPNGLPAALSLGAMSTQGQSQTPAFLSSSTLLGQDNGLCSMSMSSSLTSLGLGLSLHSPRDMDVASGADSTTVPAMGVVLGLPQPPSAVVIKDEQEVAQLTIEEERQEQQQLLQEAVPAPSQLQPPPHAPVSLPVT